MNKKEYEQMVKTLSEMAEKVKTYESLLKEEANLEEKLSQVDNLISRDEEIRIVPATGTYGTYMDSLSKEVLIAVKNVIKDNIADLQKERERL